MEVIKTFIVHVSVDAVSSDRAEMLVRDCIAAGAVTGCFSPEEDEVAVVLCNVDEIEVEVKE